MSESTWVAWCPKHRQLVGLVPHLSGNSVDIQRLPDTPCTCRNESLHIIHHSNPFPWFSPETVGKKEES